MATFLPGVRLAALFYAEVVRPLLGDLPHAAARVGPGSDVLGYDSPRSTDHDWGPRLEVFLAVGTDGAAVSQRLRHELPATFRGWSVHFAPAGARVRSMAPAHGPVEHYVTVTDLGQWCRDLLGFDPRTGVSVAQWLATPWQRLAEMTGGAVFHDDAGDLSAVRDRLRWYPDDLWRYVLACQWRKIAQEEAFGGRAAEAGDEIGSLLVTGRVCREAVRLLLLLGRRWPPYEKWVGSAIRTDPVAPQLLGALRAGGFAQREDALCAVLEEAGRRQNALGLALAVDPARRGYFDRPYQVVGADRFAAALVAAIEDRELRERPLTGAVSQVLDNTDALMAAPTPG
ncbi:MAG: hypothetical protein QOE51_5115 [Actinoplanes sp.]|jgi:hypothetical protein|nr:hypothetical protein [Actinoplanes sp.]